MSERRRQKKKREEKKPNRPGVSLSPWFALNERSTFFLGNFSIGAAQTRNRVCAREKLKRRGDLGQSKCTLPSTFVSSSPWLSLQVMLSATGFVHCAHLRIAASDTVLARDLWPEGCGRPVNDSDDIGNLPARRIVPLDLEGVFSWLCVDSGSGSSANVWVHPDLADGRQIPLVLRLQGIVRGSSLATLGDWDG